jgi:hypothetical protein
LRKAVDDEGEHGLGESRRNEIPVDGKNSTDALDSYDADGGDLFVKKRRRSHEIILYVRLTVKIYYGSKNKNSRTHVVHEKILQGVELARQDTVDDLVRCGWILEWKGVD